MNPKEECAADIRTDSEAERLAKPYKDLSRTIIEMGEVFRKSAQNDIDRCHRIGCLIVQGQDALDMALENLKDARRILTEGL